MPRHPIAKLGSKSAHRILSPPHIGKDLYCLVSPKGIVSEVVATSLSDAWLYAFHYFCDHGCGEFRGSQGDAFVDGSFRKRFWKKEAAYHRYVMARGYRIARVQLKCVN